jgi:ATP-dependent Clp protease ATP-binding subunit ClpB
MPPAAPADEVERVRGRVLAELREHFRPEFLNRVDDIIVFSRLSREQLREIVGIQLRHLRDRLAERKITLEIDNGALDVLAGEGYDPTYGARPLKRVIQRRLQDPLAMAILDGRLREGETAVVRAPDGEILIETPQHSDAVPAGAQ